MKKRNAIIGTIWRSPTGNLMVVLENYTVVTRVWIYRPRLDRWSYENVRVSNFLDGGWRCLTDEEEK
jgi:hypothetical protein